MCVFTLKTSEAGIDFHSKVFEVCSEVMKLVQVCVYVTDVAYIFKIVYYALCYGSTVYTMAVVTTDH